MPKGNVTMMAECHSDGCGGIIYVNMEMMQQLKHEENNGNHQMAIISIIYN